MRQNLVIQEFWLSCCEVHAVLKKGGENIHFCNQRKIRRDFVRNNGLSAVSVVKGDKNWSFFFFSPPPSLPLSPVFLFPPFFLIFKFLFQFFVFKCRLFISLLVTCWYNLIYFPQNQTTFSKVRSWIFFFSSGRDYWSSILPYSTLAMYSARRTDHSTNILKVAHNISSAHYPLNKEENRCQSSPYVT